MTNFTDRIKTILENQPLGELPSRESIAKRLHVSQRTLARKLVKENTSFKQLLDSHLMQVSLPYLITEDLSIEDISFIVGYQAPRSFFRAFRRWTGDSPADFRLKNRPKSSAPIAASY
mgnify:CR=1 FL=1